MILEPITLLIIIALTAVLSRLPFLRFPIDDDFAIYTYIARFADKGFQWKKNLFLIGNPIWRMRLLDKVYGNPEQGVLRLRLLFMAMHAATSLALFYAVWSFTQNLWASFVCGLLYSFYGSSPDFTAGNYSFEQFYIPFIFLGLALLPKGLESMPYAGLFFGLAAVAKWSMGSYTAVLMGVIAYRFGIPSMLVFSGFAALPVAASLLVDWKSGYMDAVGKRQALTRLATTLRLTRTKQIYFSVPREIIKVIGQTLPVWVIGLPAFFITFPGEYGIWLIPFTVITVTLIILQRGFSRYHYQPVIALLAFATGLGINHLLDGTQIIPAFGVLVLTTIANLIYILPLYTQPLDIKNLAQHEKFDQYIYIPRLGKILQRLIQMRRETEQRIFVWGTFSQLYHITGLPAADTFLHHTIGPWDSPDLEPYFDSVIDGLIHHKPVYIIKTFHDLDVTRLEQVTGLKYQLLKVVLVRFPVYRLISYQTPAIDPLSLPWQEKMQILQSLTENEKTIDVDYLRKTDCEWKHTPGINKTDLKEGRLKTALKECRKLCKLNPYDLPALFFLGKLYDWSSLPDNSSDTLKQLLKLAPNHPHVRLIMAKQEIARGNLEEAEKLIHEDIYLFGSREETDFYFGQICQKRAQHQQAADYFEKVAKTIPDWVEARIHLATSLFQLGQKKRAWDLFLEGFDQLITYSDGEWLSSQHALNVAKLTAHEHPQSETLAIFSNRAPQNEILAYASASTLEQEGKIPEARLLFEKFTSSFKKDHLRANAWFRLARLSPPDQQEPFLNECLKLAPSHTGALNLLHQLERKREPA